MRDPSFWILVIFLVLALYGQWWIYSKRLNYPPIRSDGFGYYAYLPAVLIEQDLSLERFAGGDLPGQPPFWAMTFTTEDGRPVIKYTVGVALLSLPFFLVAHVLSLCGAAPADGFSMPYQYAQILAGLFYGMMGLCALRCLLKRHFSIGTVGWTLLGTGFATNLYHYLVYDTAMSHAFSFGVISLFVGEIDRFGGRPSSWRKAAWLGSLMGAIFLLRIPNAIWWALLPLYGIQGWRSAFENFRWWIRSWRIGLCLFAGLVLTIFPQFLYWRMAIGSWFVYSYGDEHFNWGHPQMMNVLWSVDRGLFVWAPILFFAAIGGVTMGYRRPALWISLIILFPLNLYVVSSWYAWLYGGAFGHRIFVDSLALFGVGLAVVFERLRTSVLLCPMRSITVLCAAWTGWLMLKYWYHTIPYEYTTWSIISNGFFKLAP